MCSLENHMVIDSIWYEEILDDQDFLDDNYDEEEKAND